jgi:hypothetical protein
MSLLLLISFTCSFELSEWSPAESTGFQADRQFYQYYLHLFGRCCIDNRAERETSFAPGLYIESRNSRGGRLPLYNAWLLRVA